MVAQLAVGGARGDGSMDKARKALLALTAVVGASSMALQFYINMTRHNLDQSWLWRLVDFLSYFTNTTGVLATVVAAAALWRPASRLARPGVMAATAVYILVVAATYEWLLRGDPHGLALIANTGVHQVLPALVILLWLLFTPKAGLGWGEPLSWLIYPAAFMAWTLARGAAIHRYPYFFADADKLGYPRVLTNGALFLLAFYVLGLLAVAAGRVGRNRPLIPIHRHPRARPGDPAAPRSKPG